MTLQRLTIRRPDDWHVHLRDGDMLRVVAPFTARQFARAVVMPNLVPPITAIGQAADYRERIWEAAGREFTPLLTCYLTDETSPEVVESGFNDDVWIAAKLYPAGATTNSASGVTDIRNIHRVLEQMQWIGMVLCIHGEVTHPEVDVFAGRVTTRVECSEYFSQRDDALRAHATQIDPEGDFFAAPIEWQQRLWPTEEFELARSRVPVSLPETDLFAGIEVEDD